MSSRLLCLRLFVLLLPAGALVFAPALSAQSAGTGALSGTVRDTSGAVISNVSVTLTSSDTNQVRSTTTASDGSYKFPLLPPGTYSVKFTDTGFKSAEIASLNINVTETEVLDRVLEVGAQNEQITVEASAELLQTASSTLGTTVNSQTVTGLPLSNRNYTQVLSLSAGAAANVGNATAFGKATQDIAVNGNDPGQNNFQMDGVAINNIANMGSANDQAIYAGIGIPSPDAIQEFKIQTSTFDASYGRNPGANVNVVTKSGSNQYHGTAFEFFRNAQLNANDFFYNRDNPNSRTTKQVLNQNQFGGVFGGPIKKDKLFIFGSYEGTRSRNGVAGAGLTTANLAPIPAGDRSAPGFAAALGSANCAANHPGDPHFGNFVLGQSLNCDGSNVSPVALQILQIKNPDGSYYIPGSGTSGYQTVQFSIPAVFREAQVVVNGDYVMNSKETLSTRFFYSRDPQTTFTNGQLPGGTNSVYTANTNAAVKLTSILTNTLVNEARGSFQRNMSYGNLTVPGGVSATQLGMTPLSSTLNLPPDMLIIAGGYSLMGGFGIYFNPTTQYQLADQISWSHGRHTIRAGFEIEKARWVSDFPGLSKGWLFLLNFNDLLVGAPGNVLLSLVSTRSGPSGIVHGYNQNNLNSFVQDDYKVSSRLTLNLGVRWEYDGLLTDKYGNLTNIWASQLQTVPVPPATPGQTAANLTGYVVPKNFTSHYGTPPAGVLVNGGNLPIKGGSPLTNFAPRAGFAYQLTKNLVLRGGVGIFYDRVGGDRFVHAVEQGNPYAVTLDYGPGSPNTLAQPFPSTPLGFTPRWINPNCPNLPGGCNANSSYLNNSFIYEELHTPVIRQYNMTLQYEFAPRWVLDVGYVGSSGINLVDFSHNYNTAQLASPSNPINGQTTNTTANVLLRTPYLGYQASGLQGTAFDGISNYNSLQITVRKQFTHGFTMQAAYTWSKDLTDLLGNAANGNYANDLSQQYGPAYFSRPNRLVVNYSYNLPFGSPKGPLGKLVTGWNISGVTTVQDGLPLTFIDSTGGTVYGTGGTSTQAGYSRAQMCPGKTYGDIGSHGDIGQRLNNYFDSSAFCAPPILGDPEPPLGPPGLPLARIATGYGNSGPGIFLGPGQFNWDATLQKTTAITERQSIVFRAEFFNLFNHPQFSLPGAPGPNGVNLEDRSSSNFGQITSTSVNPRVIQLALKYVF